MLCSKGDKDDEKKKGPSGGHAKPVTKHYFTGWLEECSDMDSDYDEDCSGLDDDDKMVVVDAKNKKDTKKLFKDMKVFYAGKVAEKTAAEEPEGEPKAAASSGSFLRPEK